MKNVGIVLALALGNILTPMSIAQTNAVPPPGSPPPPPYTLADLQPYTVTAEGVTNYNVKVYPFLLVTGVTTNGKSILEAPPQWMLDGPPLEPKFTTLRLKFKNNLNTNEIFTVDFTSMGDTGFVGVEVVAE